jgi:hypothetical protein
MPTPVEIGYILQPGATGGSTGPNIDVVQVTGPSSQLLGRQVASWGDPNTWSSIASVQSTAPVGTEYGVVMRALEAAPNAAIATVVTNCNSTAAQISATSAGAMRRACIYKNIGPGTAYIGPAAVTTANGFELDVGDMITIPLGASLPLYAVCAGSITTVIHALELS